MVRFSALLTLVRNKIMAVDSWNIFHFWSCHSRKIHHFERVALKKREKRSARWIQNRRAACVQNGSRIAFFRFLFFRQWRRRRVPPEVRVAFPRGAKKGGRQYNRGFPYLAPDAIQHSSVLPTRAQAGEPKMKLPLKVEWVQDFCSGKAFPRLGGKKIRGKRNFLSKEKK